MGSACTLVTGATGLVGKALLQRLLERGGTVHALTRRDSPPPGDGKELRTFRWDGQRVPDEALEGLDAVVHLAGEPIFGGYPSFRRMDRVVASRVESTRTIVSSYVGNTSSVSPFTLNVPRVRLTSLRSY